MTVQQQSSLSTRLLLGAASLTSAAWPVAARIFPEKLEIDDNRAVWVSQTPDYRPGPALRETISADLAIIGGGFTGVSTAYHFSRRYPEKRVVLLEAKSLANGASGRSGGLLLNWITGITDRSPEMITRIYETTRAGIHMIEDIIRQHDLAVDFRLDGTLTVFTDAQRAELAHAEVELRQQLGIPSDYLDSTMLKNMLHLEGARGAVLDPESGHINGAQLVRSLRPILVEQGVKIYEQTPVLKIREGQTITLTTPEAEIRAKAIVLATNAYTGKLGYFRDALVPVHSHVLATAPLSEAQREQVGWQAFSGYADDMERISYACLTHDGRIVFGGGSDQSYRYLFGNRTAFPGTPESANHAFETMRQSMRRYHPASDSIPIEYRWTGTLGITLRRSALMGVRGEYSNVYYAIGFNGHGITLANIAGQVITDIYSGDEERWRGLPFYKPKYAPIPPEPFRWMGYKMFTRLINRPPQE